jgi:protein involved in polysaccharide export with SLBB domain
MIHAASALAFDDLTVQPQGRVMTAPHRVRNMVEAETYLSQFHEDAIKPLPLPRVSHENPPHEGAMIDWPIVCEPPDLILVEVLETLPGRPITGERLIRQDGTISLDFYGTIYVRGLTPLQIKEKMALHLREFLTDETLGLVATPPPSEHATGRPTEAQPSESPPKMEGDQRGQNGTTSLKPVRAAARRARVAGPREIQRRKVRPVRQAVAGPQAQQRSSVRDAGTRVVPQPAQVPESVPELPPSSRQPMSAPLRIEGGQSVKITIEVQGNGSETKTGSVSAYIAPEEETESPDEELLVIPPRDSDRVFVDVTAYNHGVYTIVGDVNAPGRLPFTGNETVLDALNYAGGVSPTGDRHNIKLVRPARGDQPAYVYKIDLDAIELKGDPKANLQILPGDRLVVGRDKRVLSTLAFERDAVMFHEATASLQRQTEAADALAKLLGQKNLTAKQRERFIKGWNGLWWPESWRGAPKNADREKLRKTLLEAIEHLKDESGNAKP